MVSQSMCNLLTVTLEIYKQLCSKYNKQVFLVYTGSGIVHQFLFQINLYEMNCRLSFIKDQRNYDVISCSCIFKSVTTSSKAHLTQLSLNLIDRNSHLFTHL